jgi:hypothetical protein
MSPQTNMKPCHQSHTTGPWAEAYCAQRTQRIHAVGSPTTSRAAQSTMPERAAENEAQAPTHDALSAIYNRGY